MTPGSSTPVFWGRKPQVSACREGDNLILFDPGAPWKIDSERLVALAGNTPFDGLPVQGKVLKTLKGGQPLD